MSFHSRFGRLNLIVFSVTLSLVGANSASAAEKATASLSFSQVNNNTYHYTLTLNDVGTTNLGTFWFAWIPGQDFMATSPTNITAPPSWTATVTNGGTGDGYAVEFVASSSAAVTPGNSLTGFAFDSTSTPEQMAGFSNFYNSTPVLTSFTYSGTPFSDSGYEFTVMLPLRLVPIIPCRLADTRNANGPFGGPNIQAGAAPRSFLVPSGACGIPEGAAAYSLNVTVVPQGSLGYLTVFPTGGPTPTSSMPSTLNALNGQIVANAAIVPAGTNGAISVYANGATTAVILDINWYFVP
jgi:hypothetical protein